MQTKKGSYKALWVIACLMFVFAIAASDSYAAGLDKAADMVLINGKVLTVDKNFSVATGYCRKRRKVSRGGQ